MGPENIVLLSIMVPKLKLKTTSIELLEEKGRSCSILNRMGKYRELGEPEFRQKMDYPQSIVLSDIFHF